MSVERRSFARFSVSKTPCRAEIRGEQHHVFQADLSINGLGIVGLDFKSLKYGEEIVIYLDDEVVEGICCSAARLPDGGLHIGVQRSCKYVAVHKSDQYLIQRFIDCGECEIPCEIVSSDPVFAKVRLKTGKSFKVPQERINSRTRNERVKYLSNDKQLELFLNFYDVDTKMTISDNDNRGLIELVVDLEFGAETEDSADELSNKDRPGPSWDSHPLSG